MRTKPDLGSPSPKLLLQCLLCRIREHEKGATAGAHSRSSPRKAACSPRAQRTGSGIETIQKECSSFWNRNDADSRFEREKEKAIHGKKKITAPLAMESITQRLKCHKEYTSAADLGKSFFHPNYFLPQHRGLVPLLGVGRRLPHLVSFLTFYRAQMLSTPCIQSMNRGQHQWALPCTSSL